MKVLRASFVHALRHAKSTHTSIDIAKERDVKITLEAPFLKLVSEGSVTLVPLANVISIAVEEAEVKAPAKAAGHGQK